ncbi:ATP-binding protein [Acidisoma cladoniae]|jgi:signal transduction histidine kinase|uniref:ATP-binding protein n=1 Tax=Acidisoma cladoniae TaxID=3040935 RepID=UPI00255147DB|nr:ATP-binding protein [Acidisoma sp. PAMC 29798]
MRRLFPDSVQGQIIAILVAALLATLVLTAALLTLTGPAFPPLPPGPWPNAMQVAADIHALGAAPPAARAEIARAMSTEQVTIRSGEMLPCHVVPAGITDRNLQLVLRTLLPDEPEQVSIRRCSEEAGGEETTDIVLALAGDAPWTLRAYSHGSFPQIVFVTLPLTVAVSFLLVLVVALSFWTLWRINRPLRNLVATVEQFGLDVAIAPLPEQGPREIRRVAQTFNRMQERIARFMEERQRMLMAIGHDLRTPLTRLRLRIELDEAPTTGYHLLHDLDLMNRMINGALSYLSDRTAVEAREDVDLGALVESLCIDASEAGKYVTYIGAFGPICRCQPIAITRAINNLLENGSRYGTHVIADVWRREGEAVIDIRDDGPGIPADMRAIAVVPFARLDSARPLDGGLGLGLSIVQEIVHRHAGHMSLLDADPPGLLVRLIIPLTAGEDG